MVALEEDFKQVGGPAAVLCPIVSHGWDGYLLQFWEGSFLEDRPFLIYLYCFKH
jgi:hypothetical protein